MSIIVKMALESCGIPSPTLKLCFETKIRENISITAGIHLTNIYHEIPKTIAKQNLSFLILDFLPILNVQDSYIKRKFNMIYYRFQHHRKKKTIQRHVYLDKT